MCLVFFKLHYEMRTSWINSRKCTMYMNIDKKDKHVGWNLHFHPFKRDLFSFVLLSQCRPCDMLEGISSLSFYILHVCMHVNQTKLEKNITCKEEKQGTSSKRSEQLQSYHYRNQEMNTPENFFFPQPPCSPQQSAASQQWWWPCFF